MRGCLSFAGSKFNNIPCLQCAPTVFIISYLTHLHAKNNRIGSSTRRFARPGLLHFQWIRRATISGKKLLERFQILYVALEILCFFFLDPCCAIIQCLAHSQLSTNQSAKLKILFLSQHFSLFIWTFYFPALYSIKLTFCLRSAPNLASDAIGRKYRI